MNKQNKLYKVEIAGTILTKTIRWYGVEYKMLEATSISYELEKNDMLTYILTEEEIKEADERLWQFAKELIY